MNFNKYKFLNNKIYLRSGEGTSGFNVRGGRADQNLILLDDAVLYNPSHFLGFFENEILNLNTINK